MIEVPEGFRVKLVRDYTRYHRDLRVGLEGRTTVPAGRAAMGKNQFLRVIFFAGMKNDVKIAVDVLRCDVDVVDERWTEWQGREAKEQAAALKKHVTKATIFTTQRGGFVELVVEYGNGRLNDTWKKKNECKDIIADLEGRGLIEEAVKKKES
jgi:hypothetical protein